MAKSLNSTSRSHYSYNQYPYPAMEQPPEYSGAGCPCPMGICLASGCPHANRNKARGMDSTFSMSPGVFKYSSVSGHIKPGFGASLSGSSGYEGGEMMSLDDEISSLQKENNHSDSQLHRIKADVAGMETEANGEDKESAEIKRRNAKLSDYYENLRTNVFSILGPKPVMRVPGAGGEAEMGGPEKYDSYLTKLQNICTEQVGEDSQPGPGAAAKPVTESLKSALQNISVLPTPT